VVRTGLFFSNSLSQTPENIVMNSVSIKKADTADLGPAKKK
jgi:hypothetical protein